MGALRDAANTGASYGRLVCVTDMGATSRSWSELPLRVMHAVVALLAQQGMIAGGSLVVLDKSGYGPGSDKLDEGLRGSRYNFWPIGRGLLVARADELVIVSPEGYGHSRLGTNKKRRV